MSDAFPLTVAVLKHADRISADSLVDWGPVENPIGEPVSHTSGKLLIGGSGTVPEAGYWRCSPGVWRCVVDRTEFCHFLHGNCHYEPDSGDPIHVTSGDTIWFPAGWRGRCTVVETVAKVYVIL